ncbi:tetratricopeptide repeat protein [Aliidiomarina maris]|uniref:Uncharacterized protein n=1 Tax=Aliidiomarina maris TaxID=531312 RepID=A0A327X4C8_9GAMM|nr:tetratricopeptide repeat protein [Aliidiomarina maris]MCL4409385.1 tetratricopeptide repeat protein [Gammaproteobacteria bacterium]RAK01847.1 hypothetical protein B0I24_101486 [Aliidiomarina maris]RUO28655.1 hypothetical protein CWE07_02355 [Aliidiomarina maris]
MTFKYAIIAGAVALGLGLSSLSSTVYAQEEMSQEEVQQQERQEAFVDRQRRTDNIDIGFRIPSPSEVQQARDSRRNQAASERIGRRIMQAFEAYEEDDIPGAIEILEGASPRGDYDVAYVNRFLGNMYAANEQPERALSTLQQAVDLDILGFSDQAAAMLLLANLNLQEENYSDALRYYQRWIQFTGELDPDVFVRMSNSHLELNNYEQVIPLARKALHYMREPNRNPFVLQVAAFFELQRTADAIRVLEEGVQTLPTEKRWWAQLGMLYFQEEQYDRGLATLELAYLAGFLEQQNDFRALAQMYSNNMIPYRAAEVMRRHLESGDIESSGRNWSIAASSYHAAREFNRANDMYLQAVEATDSRQERHDYHRRRGNSLLLASNYVEATRAFTAAIETAASGDSSIGRVYMSLAEAHFYNERYAEAVRAAENAARYSDQRRNAESWANYIRSTAERRGVSL